MVEGAGQIAHDIGSNPLDIFGSNFMLGYSGPTSDGGSMFEPQNLTFSSFNALQSLASPISIEAVVWVTGTPATNGFLVAWDGTTAGYAALAFTTALHFAFNCNSGSLVEAATRLTQTWHHVVGTWDNVNLRLYVDGALAGTTPVAGPHTFTNKLGVGGVPGVSTVTLQSFIAEVAIYSAALSLAQVAAHYAALDQLATPPSYVFGVGLPPAGGGGGPTTDLSTIAKYVSKTY